MSEDKQLAKKLANVMNEVKYIQKTGFNAFHKYKYATEADVNEKVREELAKQNVIMLPSMLGHTMRIHTNRNGATEYITCVDMEFRFVDGDTGEEYTINMSGEGQDAGDKGIYKAIAGAQKYALMKVFMIPTGDDPEADEGVDERNHKPAPKPAPTPPKPNPNPATSGQPQTQQAQGKQPPGVVAPDKPATQEKPVDMARWWAQVGKLGLNDKEVHVVAGRESLKGMSRAELTELYDKCKIVAQERKGE
jgi:hypothetical protein